MLIRYTRDNVHSCGPVRLLPGNNDVREEDWDKIKDNPLIQARIERGDIVLRAPPPKAAPVDDSGEADDDEIVLVNYKANEAKEIIEDTLDVVLLKKWLDGEKRKGVRTMIEAQIAEIEGPDESEGESNEE